MLTKLIIDEEPVRELLSYAVFPDPDSVAAAVQLYKTDAARELYGLEKDGVLVGIAGCVQDHARNLELLHIAVHPEYRGQGYGRGLLLELIALLEPLSIHAETDEEAVDFYRNVGFIVTGLGEKYPGVERFQCMYEAEPADEADE